MHWTALIVVFVWRHVYFGIIVQKHLQIVVNSGIVKNIPDAGQVITMRPEINIIEPD